MAISQTSLPARSAGQAGHVTDHGTLHTAVNDLTTVFNGWSAVIGTGKNPVTGCWHPEGYGADPTGVTDSGPAINSAVAACVAAGGGEVRLGPGTFKISTTINLSNIHPLAYHYDSDPGLIFSGAGKHATQLTGGETAYGFMELVGSNRITVRGMSMKSTGTLQYGILTGRKAGDGSSGEHHFLDVSVYGAFSVAALFAMSSEICTYRDSFFYATAGRGVVLARDNTFSASAKYTALSTTSPIVGGNGVNTFDQVQILSISATGTDYPLTLEYVQNFRAESLYIYSENQTAQIFITKGPCVSATFTSLQQEYGAVRPLGIYFSAAGASPSSPDFRGVQLFGGRAASIYAEDATRLTELIVDGVTWRGADTWQIDVDTLWNSTINVDTRATSAGTLVTNPQYRVRTTSAGNRWGPTDVSHLVTPVITLGTTFGSGGTFGAGTYYWVITATNSYGETVASNQVTATVAANGRQTLDWYAAPGATGYTVYRGTVGGGPYLKVAAAGNVVTYIDTGTSTIAVNPPTVATGGRPSAVYRGKGAVLWDATIGKPIWSDGTQWKDASGPSPSGAIPGATATVGNYFVVQQGVVTTQAFTGSYQILYLFPMNVLEGPPVDRACLEVTTLGTGVIRHGIYANDPATGQPLLAGPIADFGTVDVTSTGVKESTLSPIVTLPLGWHWYGLVWQTTNTTAPAIRVLSQVAGFGPLNLGSTSAGMSGSRLGYFMGGVTGALGALSGLATHQLLLPRVAYRRA